MDGVGVPESRPTTNPDPARCNYWVAKKKRRFLARTHARTHTTHTTHTPHTPHTTHTTHTPHTHHITQDRGLSSPPPNPHSVFADDGNYDGEQHGHPTKPNVWRSFKRLAGSPKFLLVCLGAALVGTMREIFETNLSNFLEDMAGAPHSTAVAISAVFPLCGIPGIIISGWLVDRFERRRNGRILVAFAIPLAGLYVPLAGLSVLGFGCRRRYCSRRRC